MGQKNNPAVVFDTNVWISFLISNRLAGFNDLFSSTHLTILYSSELIREFSEVALRSKFKKYFSVENVQFFIERILQNGTEIKVFSKVSVCRDSNDNFLLSLCKDGDADFLITGDTDLLVLEFFNDTRIISPADFLILQSNQ